MAKSSDESIGRYATVAASAAVANATWAIPRDLAPERPRLGERLGQPDMPARHPRTLLACAAIADALLVVWSLTARSLGREVKRPASCGGCRLWIGA
jgi:hypothetical protein